MIKFFNKSLILFKKTLCAESKVLVLAKVISFFKNKIDPFFGWSCYFVYAQILDVHVDCPVLNTIITKKVFRRFAEACNFIKKETPTEVSVKHSQATAYEPWRIGVNRSSFLVFDSVNFTRLFKAFYFCCTSGQLLLVFIKKEIKIFQHQSYVRIQIKKQLPRGAL